MDMELLSKVKKQLVSEIDTENQRLSELKTVVTDTLGSMHINLPKVRLYYETKENLRRKLRDYGYQGKTLETLIHKVDTNKVYLREDGNEYYTRSQCNYLLYSDDKELNDELQFTLTLDEAKCTVLYTTEGRGRNTYYYGNIENLTSEELDNMPFSKKTSALRELRNSISRQQSYLSNKRNQILSFGSERSTTDNLTNALTLFQEYLRTQDDK